MKTSRSFGSLGSLVAACLLALPATAAAQNGAVSLGFRGGIAVPTGDLADLMNTSASFQVDLDVPIHEVLDIRLAGGADLLKGLETIESGVGAGRPVADLSLVRFQAGLNAALAGDDGPFTADVYGTGGVTVANSQREEYPTGEGGAIIVDVSSVYPSVGGGVDLGYRVAEQVSVFLSGQGMVAFSDEEETQEYTRLGPIGNADGISSMVTFPVSAGVRLSFPE